MNALRNKPINFDQQFRKVAFGDPDRDDSLIELFKNGIDIPEEDRPVIEEIVEWEFTFERDRDDLVKKIIAKKITK